MAHYAFLDDDNKVIEVITGIDEDNTSKLPEGFSSWEEWYADFKGKTCKKTSYNTSANAHSEDGTPFRGNYAGIGFTYDADNDVFYEPQPYTSWVLSSNWVWEAPIAEPSDADTVSYDWDEEAYQSDNTQGWVTR